MVLFNIWFYNLFDSGNSSCYRYTQKILHFRRNDRRSMDSPFLLWVSEISTFKSIFANEIQTFLSSTCIPCRTFFRIDNICAYSIMIVISALSIYAVGLGKLFVLELYLRGGFQLIACSKDLKNEIDNTNLIISELLICIWFYFYRLPKYISRYLNGFFFSKYIPDIEMTSTWNHVWRIIWCTLCRFIKSFWSKFASIRKAKIECEIRLILTNFPLVISTCMRIWLPVWYFLSLQRSIFCLDLLDFWLHKM